MKSRELHRIVRKNGWIFIKAEGSHYIYLKENRYYPVPFHGSKEVPTGTARKIAKEMGLQ